MKKKISFPETSRRNEIIFKLKKNNVYATVNHTSIKTPIETNEIIFKFKKNNVYATVNHTSIKTPIETIETAALSTDFCIEPSASKKLLAIIDKTDMKQKTLFQFTYNMDMTLKKNDSYDLPLSDLDRQLIQIFNDHCQSTLKYIYNEFLKLSNEQPFQINIQLKIGKNEKPETPHVDNTDAFVVNISTNKILHTQYLIPDKGLNRLQVYTPESGSFIFHAGRCGQAILKNQQKCLLHKAPELKHGAKRMVVAFKMVSPNKNLFIPESH